MPPTTKHGWCGTRAYESWIGMLRRCDQDPRYYERGILVCSRWRDINNFIADMGERPEGLSLERIDNEGDYEPSNCRWATKSEQAKNRRQNGGRVHLITFRGETLRLAEWARRLKISSVKLRRYLRAGCTMDDIHAHYGEDDDST